MDIQKPIDYHKMLAELMSRRAQLLQQRNQTEIELVKVRQLILAIFPLVPEGKEKKGYRAAIEQVEAEISGLQDAVKLVFSAHAGEWLTAANVRDYLNEMGFDFSRNQANPLSSISTTLRRMVPDYLEAQEIPGSTTTFRRKLSAF